MKGNNGSCLQDTTPLCHVLSYSTDGVNGPDLLYVIISDIVRFILCLYINCFITNYYRSLHIITS